MKTPATHDVTRMPLGHRPGLGSRQPTKKYLVTVVTENHVEIDARDVDHARTLVERRILADFGGPMRSPRISEIEEVEGA